MQTLLPGAELVETAVGACLVRDKVYPLAHRHGEHVMGELLAFSPETAVPFIDDARLREMDFRHFLFLDTETTGLAGAGTLAFMVGVAFFAAQPGGDALVVRQFFLRDHADEAAMLTQLDELLAERPGLITFNGRSFDLPLLDGRYLMNRMPGDLLQRPHLDLLHPARRLWRNRFSSCALAHLETNLLGVQRSGQDAPGWLIPRLYQDYLRSGDGRELTRVFYHNQIDMLSMVTLLTCILRLVAHPDPEQHHPVDLYSLGKWQADLALAEPAEQTLRRAAAADLPLDVYHKALSRLGLLLKRQERWAEAVPIWRQMAATSFDSVEAHVELAKYHEWRADELDLEQALAWTEQALVLSERWPAGQATLVTAELEHRRRRLQRKLEGG